MSALFLAPLFLTGLLLVGAPWLIHHIRRPERRELRFSSLMFVPDFKKEVIERRRLQHLLLMVLRMLLLALLALAFSRPFRAELPPPVGVTEASPRHMILLDRSYSMAYGSGFDRAKTLVAQILDDIPVGEPVGLIAFAASPTILASLAPSEPAGRRDLLKALADSRLALEATDFPAALRLAERILLAPVVSESAQDLESTVHLISDFQKPHQPEADSEWRLSGRIRFIAHPVTRPDPQNTALTRVTVQDREQGGKTLAALVKNWSSTAERQADILLFIDDREIERRTVKIRPGNASQVNFLLPDQGDQAFSGYLEIGQSDDLNLDNRRYFAWTPPRREQILIVTEAPEENRWPASWFIHKALLQAKQTHWALRHGTQADLLSQLRSDTNPDLIIAADLPRLLPESGSLLAAYLNGGGRILFTLPPDLDPVSANRHLFNGLGLQVGSTRFKTTRPGVYQLLSWVDFEHPAFRSFQGSRFNDFSQIRFHNYHLLEAQAPAAVDRPPVRPMARFEGGENDQPIAMAELALGRGRMILWAFSPELSQTNLPKHIKFVPLLHETLNGLLGEREAPRHFGIGQNRALDLGNDKTWILEKPSGERLGPPESASDLQLSQPGLLKWKAAGAETWQGFFAVNIQAVESDPQTMDPAAFALKYTSNSALPETARASGQTAPDPTAATEFGRFFIWFTCFFLLVESLLALRLSHRAGRSQRRQAHA